MQATRFGGAGCRWGDAHALAGLPVSARRASPMSKWTGRRRRAGLRWRTGSRAGSAGSLGTSRGVDHAGAARDGHLGPAGAEHAQAHRRVVQAHVPLHVPGGARDARLLGRRTPTRCWFGGGRQSRGGGLSSTNGWVLCLGSQYGVRVCRHNPRPTPINRTHSTVSGGRPTLDCGVIKQGRRAGHHPRGWVKWSDQRAGTKPAAVIIVAPAASWADFTPQSIGVGVRPVGLPTRGVATLTRTFERSVMAW